MPLAALLLCVTQPPLRGRAFHGAPLREGTDYGERELSLDEKVARVTRQLERGEAQIVFDPDTDSVDIAPVRGGGGRSRCR